MVAGLLAITATVGACSTSVEAPTRNGSPGPQSTSTSASGPEEATTLPPLEILIDEVEPIYGYGDFSAFSFDDAPWDLITAAEIACMRDQGFPVEADGATGILFGNIPDEQNQAAQVAFARCAAGLSVPEYGMPAATQVVDIYEFWVEVLAPCLESEGYQVPDPPSLTTFVESYPAVEWMPWRAVTNPTPELEKRCPQNPYDHELLGE